MVYNYEADIPVRMVIDKNGTLQELFLEFEVLHEVPTGGKGERILLGRIKVNLAEYVEASEQEGEDGVTRRYLMQDSKINSTLKIGVFLKQTEGDRNFSAPSLKVAPVFSGIAGILVAEPEDTEGTGPMPAVNSKHQIAGDELKELYRRTVAANWTAMPGALAADRVLEDIFSGGDGWGSKIGGGEGGKTPGREGNGALSDDENNSYHRRKHSKWSQGFAKRRPDHLKRHSKESLSRRSVEDLHGGSRALGVRGRASFEQQTQHMKEDAEIGHNRHANEMDEMGLREDLRSWKIPPSQEPKRLAPTHHPTVEKIRS